MTSPPNTDNEQIDTDSDNCLGYRIAAESPFGPSNVPRLFADQGLTTLSGITAGPLGPKTKGKPHTGSSKYGSSNAGPTRPPSCRHARQTRSGDCFCSQV